MACLIPNDTDNDYMDRYILLRSQFSIYIAHARINVIQSNYLLLRKKM